MFDFILIIILLLEIIIYKKRKKNPLPAFHHNSICINRIEVSERGISEGKFETRTGRLRADAGVDAASQRAPSSRPTRQKRIQIGESGGREREREIITGE